MTRPDISFAVNKLCQYMHARTDVHWKAIKWLLRYLASAISYGLFVTHNPSCHIQYYTNSDWGDCNDDPRSINGDAIYLGCNLVSWDAKKQPTVARLYIGSEYKSLENGMAEVFWIQSLLTELDLSPSVPAILWCDNIGAIYFTSNHIFHARTKHIELDYHTIRKKVGSGQLQAHCH
ncbi:hypothetical protein ACH5RR_001281 [Cinchona calisaya]|uniref:Uncharacterized protein n=1 Tax=Cinchona calisaya TaxID=153742 RepID=A0ABD3B2Z0_9GENT